MTAAERETMISESLYIAEAEAGRYHRRCPAISRDDHYSAGVLGLMKAAEAYDASRGNAFKTLAGWYVRGEIKHQIRAWSRTVRNAPAGLLVQIASLDEMRPAGLHSDGDTMTESVTDGIDVQSVVFDGLDASDIGAAIDSLPPDWAEATRRILMDGQSWASFGESRGWTPGQTKRFATRFKSEIGARLRANRGVAEMVGGRTVRLPLTNGSTAQIDEFDADRLIAYRWHPDQRGFAYRMEKQRKRRIQVRLHHDVVGAVPERHRVIAVDASLLNCRRSNLVIVPLWQAYHRQPARNRTGLKGVTFDRKLSKWAAFIKVDGKQLHLGCFGSPKAAAEAHDKAAREYLGPLAVLNFPAHG